MKHSTPSLLKFKKLHRRLGLKLFEVIGVLESIWVSAYNNFPCGDIGRFSNEDIAALIEYPGDPDELIKALVDTHWLDVDSTHRLVIHDWPKHCAKFLKGNLNRWGKQFAIADYTEQPAIVDYSKDLSILNHNLTYTEPNPTPSPLPPPPEQEKPTAGEEGKVQIFSANRNHPAIKAYSEITGKTPNRIQENQIIQRVGQEPKAIEFWKEVISGSMLVNVNGWSVAALIDWFQRGEIPGKRGGKDFKPPPRNDGYERHSINEQFEGLSIEEIQRKAAEIQL